MQARLLPFFLSVSIPVYNPFLIHPLIVTYLERLLDLASSNFRSGVYPCLGTGSDVLVCVVLSLVCGFPFCGILLLVVDIRLIGC